MRTFSTSDLSRKSGDIIASALQSPVSINQRGKPRLIMLSVEQYETLTRDASQRLVGATADMPMDLAHDVEGAIDGYLQDIAPQS
ncbi:type II toxin-antitoxin system Phd/YefM family antitoxin [Neokomagataea thailandica]|uniref:Antitoxin n=1 Tax=Neokomagataea tanensis NBRC 106556 TaxID=1223519 RepID=A0ABQ0QKX4_9PROT|nr:MULTISPECIES: type II toxin-antitoxin system Phd/YefM family antitoxin [Neokomagataea]GBR48539.1 hypothetical protein AA106556_1819 [Neokomagataea tanensis NBRC 106556]